jgi:zinc protease
VSGFALQHRLRTWIAAATIGAAVTAAAAPAFALKIDVVTSPGGIEAWLVREPAMPVVAMSFAFRGGSSQDPVDKPGVANLMSALLDEGAGPYDSQAFHRAIDDRAVEFRFNAERDYFRGSLRVLREHRDGAFELLRLMLAEPHFNAPEVERIRAQTIAGLAREATRPGEIASRAWWSTAFPGHPYGQPVKGTEETVARITIDDLKSYRRRVLARDGLKVALIGDITPEDAGKLLDHVFGGLAAKGELTPVADVIVQGLGQRIVRDVDVPQATVMFGGRGIARKDPQFIAAYVVNHIMGGGSFTSRLYEEVREKRGLAYSISNSLLWLRHAALVIGGTATRSDRTADALAIIESESKRMHDEGPTAEELAKAKAFLKGAYALDFDTSTKIVARLLQIQLDDLGVDYIERRSAMIDAVTLDDARRAAKRLFGNDLLVTIAGRPRGLTSKATGG